MYKRVITLVISFLLVGSLFTHAHAQMMGENGNGMMGTSGTTTVTPTQQDLQDIQTGKDLFDKFQSKQVTCSTLKDDDFEKIGEYLMNQSFGNNTNAHIQMNNAMKQMMGENGEEQMHIRLAKNATGCNTNGQGGGTGMMGNWGWTGSMMGGNWFGALGVGAFLFWLVAFIDLILLGIFLWKRIGRK